jgi:hypothetical protein
MGQQPRIWPWAVGGLLLIGGVVGFVMIRNWKDNKKGGGFGPFGGGGMSKLMPF